MRRTIEMKKYIIDQMIQLIIFIIIVVVFFYTTYEKILIMFVIEAITVCSFSYLLRRILVLPLDLFQGYVEQDVYFSKICNIDEYELFKKKCYCEWNFYFSSKGKLTLLVPVCQTHEEILQMDKPATDQKIRIRYYKYSKILCSWESL